LLGVSTGPWCVGAHGTTGPPRCYGLCAGTGRLWLVGSGTGPKLAATGSRGSGHGTPGGAGFGYGIAGNIGALLAGPCMRAFFSCPCKAPPDLPAKWLGRCLGACCATLAQRTVWVGTGSGGLDVLRGGVAGPAPLTGRDGPSWSAASARRLWVGAEARACRVDQGEAKRSRDERLLILHLSALEDDLACTMVGLWRRLVCRHDGGSFRRLGKICGRGSRVVPDRPGTMWVGPSVWPTSLGHAWFPADGLVLPDVRGHHRR